MKGKTKKVLYCFSCANPLDKMTTKFIYDQINKLGSFRFNCENCGSDLYFDTKDL